MKRKSIPSARKAISRITTTALVVAMLGSSPSPLTFVSAQNSSKTVQQKNFTEITPSPYGTQVLFQGENGEIVCREGFSEETRESNKMARAERMITLSAPPSSDETTAAEQNLTIILRGTEQLDQFPQAREAFVRAANRWSSLIKNPITVVIDVDFGPTRFGVTYPSGVLGSTNSQLLGGPQLYPVLRAALIDGATDTKEKNLYNKLPEGSLPTNIGATASAFSTSALLRALKILPPIADPVNEFPSLGPPPSIGFSSNFEFDFDPADGIDQGKFDFDGVAIHEIGHALGFNSLNGLSEVATAPVQPSVWDFFRVAQNTLLGTFSTAPRIQTTGVESIFISKTTPTNLQSVSTGGLRGDRGDLFQSSHWKSQELLYKRYIGVMDPSVPRGRRYSITVNDLIALDTFGYTIDPQTQSQLPVTESSTAQISDNVLRVSGHARDNNEDLRGVFVKLYDSAGQLLALGEINANIYRLQFADQRFRGFDFQLNNVSRFGQVARVSVQVIDGEANYSPGVAATVISR